LTETLGWYGDGTLYSHTLQRPDFTDSRMYEYAALSRRLVQEQLNLDGSTAWTNSFAYDGGAASGAGLLTSAGQLGQGSALWNGGVSPLARINTETNTGIFYPASGRINGQSTVSVLLDGRPLSATLNDSGDAMFPYQWRALMELTPGVHQLTAAARHPSGFFTAWATNTFTNDIARQTASVLRDQNGNITKRIWRNPDGSTNRTQQLWWDAKDRLTMLSEIDRQRNGYLWMAEYDGLDRRLLTKTYVTTNGVTHVAYPIGSVTNQSFYDPQVEFLELGVAYGGKTEWKLYGPDMNGQYGGMNGVGGLDGVSPQLNLFYSLISDFRGNILGTVTNGVVVWNPARPTGYGAVPGYRPPALGNGADISLASAWRGRWADISGYYHIGKRLYDPVAGMWLSYDSAWNEKDPNYLTFCGGDPINGFDPDGRCVSKGVETVGSFAEQFVDTSMQQATSVAAWADDTVINTVVGTGILMNQAAGWITGDPYFSYQAQQAGSYLSPYANAGYYNAAAPGWQLATAGTIFVAPESLAGRVGSVESTAVRSANVITDPARMLPEVSSASTATRTSFYVTADGTAIPATGYRAVGGPSVAQAETGNLMSQYGPTYITFTDISSMSGAEAKSVLQLKYEPSAYAAFDTLQIIDDLSIPGGNWNRSLIPEPITSTFPQYGIGGASQAITTTPILNYTLQPFIR
jgi:RHS repeat-associated protein